MAELIPFGGRDYFILLAVTLFSRGMDFLSTWVATPHLVLEGNPLAKKLGWTWNLILNSALCVGLADWPLPAIGISTMSLLVAARNFQGAWLMHSLGEERYRDWHVQRIHETPLGLYLWCLLGQVGLTAAVGGALVSLCPDQLVPVAVGMGVITYAVAVGFYTLLSRWRLRRAAG